MDNNDINQPTNNPTLTPVQTQLQPVQNSFINKKEFIILYFFGALVLLLFVAFGAYYLGTQNNKRTAQVNTVTTTSPTILPNEKTQIDEIVNWKTYKNASLGFELEYPPTVSIDKEMNDQYNRATIFKGENLHFEVMLRKAEDIAFDSYYFMDYPIAKRTNLAGLVANVYELPNGYCDGPTCSDPSTAIVVKKGADLYHISFFGDAELSDKEEQILSTFKFIN